MADFRHILQDIKKKNFAPVYILMGAEAFYIDRIAEALEKSVVDDNDKEFDQTILYGADANAGLVMEAAGQFPMWSDRRFVALKEAQALYKAKSELDKLKAYIERPNLSTVLCITYKGEELSATSQLMKAANKNDNVVVFKSPQIRDYQIRDVVRDHCLSQKVSIEEAAIDLIVANLGNSLTAIFNEIEKLQVALSGKSDSRITADLVRDHIGLSKDFNVFELIKSLANRDYFQSLNIIQQLEEGSKSAQLIPAVGQIFNFFQKLVLAVFSSDKSDKALMEDLQLKNRFALQDIKTAMRNYNPSQAVNVIHAIREYDTRSKGISSFQKEFPLLQELILKILTS